MSATSSRTLRRASIYAGILFALVILPSKNFAQSTPTFLGNSALAALPDAPGFAQPVFAQHDPQSGFESPAATPAITSSQPPSQPQAPRLHKVIQPGEQAAPLDTKDKALLGIRNAFTPFAAVSWLAASGYEQVVNSSPNFGTDRGAFGQRLGAAVIRDSSEGIFSDSVMAPILREDPRYYRLGPGHKLPARLLYAFSRPLITRTDSGSASPNFALLTGTLAGAALTNAYYPSVNRGAAHTFQTFGSSIGGEAVSDGVREFYRDFADKLRSKRK